MSSQKNKIDTTLKNIFHAVSFKLFNEEYAININKAKEVILISEITAVPQMPDYIEGIINLRGNVIPVIDLRKRLNLPTAEYSDNTRIIVVKAESKVIGIVVDSVSQVIKIALDNITTPPEAIGSISGEYLTGIGKLDNRMLLILDIDKLINFNELNLPSSHNVDQQEEKELTQIS